MNVNLYTQYGFSNNLRMKNFEKVSTVSFNSKNPLYNLRDTNTEVFDALQKQKVEMVIKIRDASGIKAKMLENLEKAKNLGISKSLIKKLKKDVREAEAYENMVREKLKVVNLSILKEEEKNY